VAKSYLKAVCISIALMGISYPEIVSATCLMIQADNTFRYWKNNCNRKVWVSWVDNDTCKNWSCSDSVGPQGSATAMIGNGVKWCEWYDGLTGRGPC